MGPGPLLLFRVSAAAAGAAHYIVTPAAQSRGVSVNGGRTIVVPAAGRGVTPI